MTVKENLFGDLLEIAAGNIAVAISRLNQFTNYANTVPASVTATAEPTSRYPRQTAAAALRTPAGQDR